MIKFTVITLFPEAIEAYLSCSMMWKAREKGLAEYAVVNLREYGLGPHRSVDDTPYGGGDGMLLRCEPVAAAIEAVKAQDGGAKVILPTPVGELWTQECARGFAMGASEDGYPRAKSFSQRFTQSSPRSQVTRLGWGNVDKNDMGSGKVSSGTPIAKLNDTISSSTDLHYIILCPHYEGYDERILTLVDYKVRLGQFVLTGGELPALCIIDSVVRLIPGVLGGETSAEIESFSDGDNLEYPQYTKPAEWRGLKVPEVLLSGHHGKVAEWRAAHSGRVGEAACSGVPEGATHSDTLLATQSVLPEEVVGNGALEVTQNMPPEEP